MNSIFQIRPLEQRWMFDGAMAADVVDATGGDDSDTSSIEAIESTPAIGPRVVLISGAVEDSADLAAAVQGDVIALIYDPSQSLDTILSSLKTALGSQQASSIAFASHGMGDGAFALNDAFDVSLTSLSTNDALKAFWGDLGGLIADDGRLDLLACDLSGSRAGDFTVSLLSDIVGRDVAASDDATGNQAQGGDWDLELGNVNVADYFQADKLAAFDGLLAETTEMVKDINTGGGSNPYNFAAVGSTLYFRASDGTNGYELWKSDGTVGGTVMVKDINPGVGDSNVSYLTAVGSTLYFTAEDGTNGTELWKSDGTDAGTVMVKDINPGAGTSSLRYLTAVGSTLYFRASDGANGTELWKSDGTAVGTVMVKDINVGVGSTAIYNLTAVGSTLYFQANDATNGSELWKSDGTAVGTVMVKDINVGVGGSSPYTLIAVGSTLYFTADDGTNGAELWKSDGTAVGTVMIKDINTAGSSSPVNFAVIGSTLYFVATDATNGTGLWKSDGTVSGTVLVKDTNTVTNTSLRSLTAVGSTLYFRAADATHAYELWKSDGTTAGTVMVKDIHPTGSSNIESLTSIGSTLYFTANGGVNGVELWKSDGTASGTVMVMNINPTSNSFPDYLTAIGSTLYFRADDGTNGRELWKHVVTVDSTQPPTPKPTPPPAPPPPIDPPSPPPPDPGVGSGNTVIGGVDKGFKLISAPQVAIGGFRTALADASLRATMGGEALAVARPIGLISQTGNVNFTIASDAFAHTNPDETVQLIALRADGQDLPSWLNFDPDSGSFEGTPPAGENGIIEIQVIARDSFGREAMQVFEIQISEDKGRREGTPDSAAEAPQDATGTEQPQAPDQQGALESKAPFKADANSGFGGKTGLAQQLQQATIGAMMTLPEQSRGLS
ncbi:MAG: DUF4347 domain-containing protein [Magnetovibrio sp.]|nr:DUF4347 domain-containing protein [Magnetovibrio sp.]